MSLTGQQTCVQNPNASIKPYPTNGSEFSSHGGITKKVLALATTLLPLESCSSTSRTSVLLWLLSTAFSISPAFPGILHFCEENREISTMPASVLCAENQDVVLVVCHWLLVIQPSFSAEKVVNSPAKGKLIALLFPSPKKHLLLVKCVHICKLQLVFLALRARSCNYAKSRKEDLLLQQNS